jgi:hypothetical protein
MTVDWFWKETMKFHHILFIIFFGLISTCAKPNTFAQFVENCENFKFRGNTDQPEKKSVFIHHLHIQYNALSRELEKSLIAPLSAEHEARRIRLEYISEPEVALTTEELTARATYLHTFTNELAEEWDLSETLIALRSGTLVLTTF